VGSDSGELVTTNNDQTKDKSTESTETPLISENDSDITIIRSQQTEEISALKTENMLSLSFFTAVEHLDESIDLITLEIFCM
jgi:hypothetical protein